MREIDRKTLLEKLRSALTGNTGSLKIQLVHAIGTRQDPELAALLLEVGAEETDPKLKALMVESLGRALGEEQLPELMRWALDENPGVRRRVLAVMLDRGHPQTFPLAALMSSDHDLTVRSVSLEILTRLGTPLLMRLLTELLLHPSAVFRSAAVSTLNQIRHQTFAILVTRALNDASEGIRLQARAVWLNYLRAGLTPPPPPASTPAAQALTEAVAVVHGAPDLPPVEEAKAPSSPHEQIAHDLEAKSPAMFEALYGVPATRNTGIPEEGPVAAPPMAEAPPTKERKDKEICRSCDFAKMKRPDAQKMGPGRLWCTVFKKETMTSRTCARGKWTP